MRPSTANCSFRELAAIQASAAERTSSEMALLWALFALIVLALVIHAGASS